MSDEKATDEKTNLKRIRDSMPLVALLGIELIEANPEQVTARLLYNPDHTTAGGIVHGGALMTLADTCGAVCAVLNLPAGATGTATVESKTNFLRAVREGTLTATTRPIHTGRTIAVLETEIALDGDRLAAKTIQTQAYHYGAARPDA